MKIKLANSSRTYLFRELEECGYTTGILAKELNLHRRTVSDWKRGKYNIEKSKFIILIKTASLNLNDLKFETVDPVAQKRRVGRLGGIERFKKHGVLGSREDRVKGGKASYIARRGKPNDIFEKKHVELPKQSVELAEFIGICMGDGSLATYQLTISLNDEDDKDYMDYVACRARNLFGIEVKRQKKQGSRCTNLVMSSIELVDFLIGCGLPKGDKIRAGLDIPEWIKLDREYLSACLRGLFDTDGCIFLETHSRKGKKYSYPRMSLVSASEGLRESVCDAYVDLGMKAKIRMGRSINIERFTDIDKYFKIIGSSNQKHLYRFAKFGGVG